MLPGVTVEAASPAIIEKVRTAVTDDQGRYRIEALRPGTYKVTFSLTGFSTVARENIEVPSEVVVTINADMKVGALEETITVSGETPQIDVQQASRTQVITRDIIDTLPVSRNVMSIGVLSPGVRQGTPDVGGSRMTEQVGLRAHGLGGDDAEQLVEGMSIQSLEGASQAYFDDMLQSEITIMTSAIPADTSGGGIRMNSVLKDGGNIFSGAAFLGFSSGGWQSENTGDELRAAPRSINSPNAIKHIHMFTGSLGGPIMRDKMWFLVAARHQSSDEIIADVPVTIVAPDGEFINSYLDTYVRGPSLRLTLAGRAEAQDRVVHSAVVEAQGQGLRCRAGSARVAVPRSQACASHGVGNVRWTSPISNRLLFEAGYSWTLFDWLGAPMPGVEQPRGTPLWYVKTRKTDTQRQVDDECAFTADEQRRRRLHDLGIEPDSAPGQHASCVPGRACRMSPGRTASSSATTTRSARTAAWATTHNGDLYQNYTAGQPSSVDVWNTPLEAPGIVDYDSGDVPAGHVDVQAADAQSRPAYRMVQRGHESGGCGRPDGSCRRGFSPKSAGLLKWGPDYAPRFAAVYDLFGNGRTAIKANYSKYHRQYDADPARPTRPSASSASGATGSTAC